MWGSHPGARAPGRELPALRAYCAVTDATSPAKSPAKSDYKKSYVPNTCFPGPKPFTARGDAHAAKQNNRFYWIESPHGVGFRIRSIHARLNPGGISYG
ncbi:hypothetical protein LF1_48080 [Rubripirellula obstinata]|uniref:Uncharacterized protein n=1 Tax=Rubripirellula obstinata TaxID=406547 RepID=A0A5B1CNY2_9BACT|nr:hypothetical protein LF1_48080 [Rubripirellula obstinata]